MENSVFSKKNEKICIAKKNRYNRESYLFLQRFLMKNPIYILIALLTSILSEHVFADNNAGILGGGGVTATELRKWDISFSDIPGIIKGATDIILGFAGTVAVIMVIYGAFQMSLMGLTSEDKKKWADTIQHGIIGFIIAVSAWFIINLIINNL